LIVGLVGATGNVGEEILQGLAERRFPLGDLRLFASEGSDGVHLDFLEDEIRVETAHPDALARCDLLICAAPLDPAVLGGLRGRVALLDLSGALESDLAVPLVAGPLSSGPAGDVAAAARGVTAGLAWVLHALAEESAIVRATITTLEGAGGAGRRGLDALSEQTVRVLNAMDGATDAGDVFPRALAFDVLPRIGEPEPGGGTGGEARLAAALRRLLAAPELDLEITRVRVPVFLGSLSVLHLEFQKPLSVERARERFATHSEIELLDGDALPTPRSAVGRDVVLVGRLRGSGRGLSLVLAQDDLRCGAARTALDFIESRS
jgi:aspartate-semialdehyde dehydrogenase